MKLNAGLVVAMYLAGYAGIRTTNTEVWEQDGHSYVLFPKNAIYLYYLYRPMSYLDNAVTGMRSHIGPHQ